MATHEVQRPAHDIFRRGRPGWIPEWVGDEWDPNPYAYQTEEELMPAGRFHGLYLQALSEMLKPLLQRLSLHMLLDVFLFYRDWEDRKQRIGPDALIAQPVELTDEQGARSYDLDVEPMPVCVVEFTSPGTRANDLLNKPMLYAFIGVGEYLLLDITDSEGRLLPRIGVTLWRFAAGNARIVEPDAEGYVLLESLGLRVRADGRRIVAQVVATNEFLRTSLELTTALKEAEVRASEAEAQLAAEAQARVQVEAQLVAEAQARVQVEARLLALEAEVRRLRGEG